MKHVLPGFALLLLTSPVIGQETKEFYDEHGLQGTLRYSGGSDHRADSVLPQSGIYKLSWRDLAEDSVHTYYAEGRLKNHLPDAEWTWREGRWRFEVRPGSNVEPRFTTFGKRIVWQTQFTKGEMEGLWQVRLERVNEEGEVFSDLLTLNGRYESGVLVEELTIEDHRSNVVDIDFKLPLNDFGEAHGTWSMKYPVVRNSDTISVTEERHYETGLLYKIVQHYPDTSYTTLLEREWRFLENRKQRKDTFNLRIGRHAFEEDGYAGRSQVLFHEYVQQFLTGGWNHTLFPYQMRRGVPIFRKLQLPLSDRELMLIDRMKERSDSLRTQLLERLNYRNIKINRGRSAELDLAIAYLQRSEQLLDKVDSLLVQAQDPMFTYCNRSGGEVCHWPDSLNAPGEARGEVYDSVYVEMPHFPVAVDSLELLGGMAEVVEALEKSLPVYLHTIDESFNEILKADEIQALSDKLTEKLQVLQREYAEMDGVGAFVRERWVQQHLNNELKRFSREDSYRHAVKYGDHILSRMDTLLAWAPYWSEFDSMPERLNEHYRYFAYNPYTGDHDIEMPVKRRFFNAVKERLWPYLEEELLRVDEWEAWVSQMELTRTTYNSLMRFANIEHRSTRRIERRIRQEDNPDKMIRTINNYMEDRTVEPRVDE